MDSSTSELSDPLNTAAPVSASITAETLAHPTLDLIHAVQDASPAPAGAGDATSSFLDKFAALWSTSKLFDLALMGSAAGLILYGFLHGSSSVAPGKKALTVPVFSRAAAQTARAQVAAGLDGQTTILHHMGYTNSQIQTPRDQLQFIQDSAIGLNSEGSSVPKLPSAALVVTGPHAPNHYAPLHALNNSQYFASLSKKPSQADLLTNSAAMHGDAVSAGQ
jgi:hypothetical protein